MMEEIEANETSEGLRDIIVRVEWSAEATEERV